MRQMVKTLHRYLKNFFFDPLAALSGGGVALLALRYAWSRNPFYNFLLWNLFLAWIPYAFSVGVEWLHRRYPNQPARLVLPGSIWLLFLPNAPYIITDLVHLHWVNTFLGLLNLFTILLFAGIGCLLGVVSLRIVQGVVGERLGPGWGWGLVAVVLLLDSIGVYMGRFLRWNSWDVWSHPFALLQEARSLLSTPSDHLQAIGFTLVFSLFFSLIYACSFLGRLKIGAEPCVAPGRRFERRPETR